MKARTKSHVTIKEHARHQKNIVNIVKDICNRDWKILVRLQCQYSFIKRHHDSFHVVSENPFI